MKGDHHNDNEGMSSCPQEIWRFIFSTCSALILQHMTVITGTTFPWLFEMDYSRLAPNACVSCVLAV